MEERSEARRPRKQSGVVVSCHPHLHRIMESHLILPWAYGVSPSLQKLKESEAWAIVVLVVREGSHTHLGIETWPTESLP